MGRRLLLFAAIAFIALSACTTEKTPTEGIGLDHSYIVFHHPKNPLGVRVEIADTNEEHTVGLMNREFLPPYSGMLFVFESPIQGGFWMKNTLIPLDIVFIDRSWKIVGMHTEVQPCTADPCQHYYSEEENVKYVLEVNAGFMYENGITVGDSMLFLA